MAAVKRFAADGGLVLGICNGFQILCEAGLLPGVLRPNRSLEFVCCDATLVVGRNDLPFTERCEPGQRLTVPVKCGEGAWLGEVAEEQVVFRYDGDNPTGSQDDVAGVCNEWGNVLGLMPHPERSVEALLGSTDGLGLFRSLAERLAPAEIVHVLRDSRARALIFEERYAATALCQLWSNDFIK